MTFQEKTSARKSPKVFNNPPHPPPQKKKKTTTPPKKQKIAFSTRQVLGNNRCKNRACHKLLGPLCSSNSLPLADSANGSQSTSPWSGGCFFQAKVIFHLEDHPRTCKWLGSPPFISHETPIWKGNNPT